MDALHFSNFLNFSMSPLEILIRGTIMYWCLFLLLRFLLRRDTGSAGISGILFVVLLGDAAQNAMIGNGNTVADGAMQPHRVGPIPPQCLGLNRTFLNPVELTVRAVVEGSREHVYHAALLDPNTAATLSTEQIVNMVDELIEAHGELIPEPIRRG